MQLPPWTILSHKNRIEIFDAGGKRAVARKTIVLRPNHRGKQFYTHRNISIDGGTVTFKVDASVTLVTQERHAGDYVVTVQFPQHLARFRAAPDTSLEMELTDAFT